MFGPSEEPEEPEEPLSADPVVEEPELGAAVAAAGSTKSSAAAMVTNADSQEPARNRRCIDGSFPGTTTHSNTPAASTDSIPADATMETYRAEHDL